MKKTSRNTSTAASAASAGSGGLLNSGILAFFGTTINCNAESDSYYCNFMKIFNVLMVMGIIASVLFFVYQALKAKK